MERSGGKRRSATPWLRVPKRVACSREVFEWRASCLGKVARPLVSQSPRSLDEPWVRKWKRCVWVSGSSHFSAPRRVFLWRLVAVWPGWIGSDVCGLGAWEPSLSAIALSVVGRQLNRAAVAGVVELAAFPVLIVLVCPVFSVVCPWWSGAWVGLGVDFGRRGGRLACFLSSPLSPLDRLVIRRVCHGTCSGR